MLKIIQWWVIKMNKMEEKCWIEIHQVCGDCGRRIKQIIPITGDSKEELKAILHIVKCYYPKYNMACKICSNK